MTDKEAAEAWGVKGIPGVNMDDPGQVEAWFSGGHACHSEHYRKVVLANCREMVRAQFALKGEKVTETRLDDLARLSDNYLTYLKDSLEGRSLRETMVRQRMGV